MVKIPKLLILFFCCMASLAWSQSILELTTAEVGRGILGTGAIVGLSQSFQFMHDNHLEPFWMALRDCSSDLEMALMDLPESTNGIDLAASDKDKIDGHIRAAEREAKKILDNDPNRDKRPKNHWLGEVKGILSRALRLAEKRLAGKTRDEYVQRILKIAEQVGIDLLREP